MPGFEARHATRRARHTREAVIIVIVLALGAVLVVVFGRGLLHHSTPPRRPARHAAAPPRVTATLASWRLGAPISRAVVVAGTSTAGDQLVILGGMTTGGLTASGAFDLDVTDGTLTQVGDLSSTLDEASGAVIDGQAVVCGGTSPPWAPPASAAVQALSAAAPAAASPGAAVPTSTALGTLPQARAGATT